METFLFSHYLPLSVAHTVDFLLFHSSLSSIIILPSLFNLLRILQFHRYSGSLSGIDAILGTSLLLPAAMALDSNGDIFDEFTEDVCKQILDMHFHTVNFWRECISAYVSQHDPSMRRKVLTRLTEVIQFEMRIQDLLKTAPDDYVPPVCHFMSPTNNMRRNLVRFKKPTGKTRVPYIWNCHFDAFALFLIISCRTGKESSRSA